MDYLEVCFEPVRELWRETAWPGVEESLSYGTPALKVRGKLLIRLRDAQTLVVLCDLDEKEFLMKSQPDIYYETDHYNGYPAVLARISEIGPDALRAHIEKKWRELATKNMIEEYEASHGPRGDSTIEQT